MQLSAEEVREELRRMAYRKKGFDEVINFVWALPDSFWARVSKRLIATVIVGVQPDSEPETKTWWSSDGCFKTNYPRE